MKLKNICKRYGVKTSKNMLNAHPPKKKSAKALKGKKKYLVRMEPTSPNYPLMSPALA